MGDNPECIKDCHMCRNWCDDIIAALLERVAREREKPDDDIKASAEVPF
jgi:hypothetical protein